MSSFEQSYQYLTVYVRQPGRLVMKRIAFVSALILLLLTGCGDTTGSRALSGGGMGAAAGGLIGSMSGNFGTGAAIGAGVGVVGGYLYDQHEKGNID